MPIIQARKLKAHGPLLAVGLLLLCGLGWVAKSYPMSSDQTLVTIYRLDDRFSLVQHKHHQTLQGMHHGEGTVREYVLDEQSGGLQALRKHDRRGRFYSDYSAQPLSDGRVFWHEQYADGITILDPRSRKRSKLALNMLDSLVVGNRYLVRASSNEEGQQFEWLDLLAAQPKIRQSLIATPSTADDSVNPTTVPGCDCFYKVYEFYRAAPPAEEDETAEVADETSSDRCSPGMSSESMGELEPEPEPEPDKVPLIELKLLDPQPLPTFAQALQWLVLYRQTPSGPETVSAWPIVSNATIAADNNWISTLSLDGACVECRNATTGEVVRKIPVPPASKTADLRVHFGVVGDTLSFHPAAGYSTVETYDLLSGKLIPTDGNYFNRILNREGDRYLTLEPFDHRLIHPWPPWFRVREVATGKTIVRFPLPADDCYFNGDFIGSTIRLHSTDRMFYVDIATDQVTRIVSPFLWSQRLGVLIVATAWLWIFLWIRSCSQKQESALFCYGVITLGSVTFLGLRLQLSGDPWVFERIAWQLLLGMLLAWTLAGGLVVWTMFLKRVKSRQPPRFSLRFLLIATAVCAILFLTVSQISWSRWSYWLSLQYVVPNAAWVAMGVLAMFLITGRNRHLLHRCSWIAGCATIMLLVYASLADVWSSPPRFWIDELWHPGCALACVAVTNAIAFYRVTPHE